jgi:hypothetical protein
VTAQLLVTMPPGRPAEREWVTRVLCERFLGQSVEMASWDRDFTAISCVGHDGVLTVPDRLLSAPPSAWLTPASLPEEPLHSVRPDECVGRNDLPFDEVPGIYWPVRRQDAGQAAAAGTITAMLPFDLFGSAFFMLTRYEECVMTAVRDEHDRFPGSASLAFRHGFLETPVVDQYVELLWAALTGVWPGLERPVSTYRLWVTHDVDSPYSVFRRNRLKLVAGGLKGCAQDALVRRDAAHCARRARVMVGTLLRGPAADPHFNLRTLMDIDEAHSQSATFFYMADEGGRYGAAYSLDDPAIRDLIRATRSRGHEIGLHAGYGSMTDAAQVGSEWRRLRSTAASLGIEQASWGSRTHFVRWSAHASFRNADACGADFDSTLAYADQAGFRCGTSHEYPAFDLSRGRPLRLRVRPPIAMEYSVTDPHYMGKTAEEALVLLRRLATQCRTYGGTFTLLWHNHNLVTPAQTRLYEAVLEECS